jgi:hypothetical protein
MNYTFKYTSILIFLFSITIPNAYSQDFEILDYDQFQNFEINGKVTFVQLIDNAGKWDKIKQYLGEPDSEESIPRPEILGYKPTKIFNYDGLIIKYIDMGNNFELSTLTIHNNSPYLSFYSTIFRVGDNISKIKSVFPEAYQKKHSITTNKGTNYLIKLNINNSVTYIIFKYNSSNNNITEIKLMGILT